MAAHSSELSVPPAGEENSITDVEQFIDQLETSSVKIDYHPLPDEIQNEIKRLCIEHKVGCAIWSQSPHNWKRTTILGIGAEAMKSDLKVLETRFPEFTFEALESGPLHIKQYRKDVT